MANDGTSLRLLRGKPSAFNPKTDHAPLPKQSVFNESGMAYAMPTIKEDLEWAATDIASAKPEELADKVQYHARRILEAGVSLYRVGSGQR